MNRVRYDFGRSRGPGRTSYICSANCWMGGAKASTHGICASLLAWAHRPPHCAADVSQAVWLPTLMATTDHTSQTSISQDSSLASSSLYYRSTMAYNEVQGENDDTVSKRA